MPSTRSNARDNSAEQDAASGQAAMADATREQLATTASAASALLRAMDTLQQTQAHMLQRAALLQEQTAERLRNASTPMEVMSIQSGLLMSGWSELAQYTQELVAASLKAQGEFMRPPQQQQAAATQAAASAAPPLFQAWQAMFTAPLNGAVNRTH
jgi:hypothetical protein